MAPPTPAPPPGAPGYGRLVLGIAGFVLVGVPLLAFVWEGLNRLLSGTIHARLLVAALIALALLVPLWRFLARTVVRWDARRHGLAPDELPTRRQP
ncbi:MAG TPA: hypothetical protein VFS40_05500 [Gemmatimonadales bacterium]|nr:hypothetical protein [Gemmatimonadales bacterium]